MVFFLGVNNALRLQLATNLCSVTNGINNYCKYILIFLAIFNSREYMGTLEFNMIDSQAIFANTLNLTSKPGLFYKHYK